MSKISVGLLLVAILRGRCFLAVFRVWFWEMMVDDSRVDADEEFSGEAGVMHCEMKREIRDFGLANSYVLASARRTNSKVITGDPHLLFHPEV